MFKARFVSLGNEFKMHHLHLIEIKPTGEKDNLSSIIVKESALP